MKHIMHFLIATLMISALFVWYDHLWLPDIHLRYGSQILPMAGTFLFLACLLKKSWIRYLLTVPAGLLFVGSVIAQLLVWIDLLHLPLF